MSNISKRIDRLIELAQLDIIEEQSTVIEDAEKCDIIRRFGIVDHRGVYNACVDVKGFDKPMRGRSEIIIFRDGKIYMNPNTGKNEFYSRFPGGGWNKNENPATAAAREAQEEVYLNVRNVRYAGTFIKYSDKVVKWVKENIPEKDWWYGYYTKLYVADYDGKYTGRVDEEDKDDMAKTIKLYDIDEVYHSLSSYYKRAVDIYLGKNTNK